MFVLHSGQDLAGPSRVGQLLFLAGREDAWKIPSCDHREGDDDEVHHDGQPERPLKATLGLINPVADDLPDLIKGEEHLRRRARDKPTGFSRG